MPQDVSTAYKQEKNKQDNKPINLYVVEDYNSLAVAGSATSTLADHLVDTAAAFVSADVGRTIHNTTDDTYAIITAVNSTSDVTLSKDIMISRETYELEDNLYFAEHKEDVTFDDITYTKFPMSREAATENTSGEIDVVKIRLANVSRVIQYYLENYDLGGKKVIIRQVWADKLADVANVRTEVFYIDRYTASDKVVEFDCSSKFDVQDVELPFGRYMRGVCRWKRFKDANCKYVGGYATCNRTMAACRERQNIINFGAFPSVPSQRTVLS